MDGYLYVLTILPLRVIIALLLLIIECVNQFLFVYIIKIKEYFIFDDDNKPYKEGDSIKMKTRRTYVFFHRYNGYDLLR
jgi:hypothetical protein